MKILLDEQQYKAIDIILYRIHHYTVIVCLILMETVISTQSSVGCVTFLCGYLRNVSQHIHIIYIWYLVTDRVTKLTVEI